MHEWLSAQLMCEQQQQPYALVSVTHAQGSGPRSVGAKMLVTATQLFGSIGGGHLEHKATQQARDILLQGPAACSTYAQTFTLGANLGQCCGGTVALLFEYRTTNKMPVVVFGAGHVGRALVPILATLPVAVTWVDGRYDMLPSTLPEGITALHEDNPVDVIASCPPSTCYLIMTHHHGLDLQLAEAALKRGDGVYVGVIGSNTKGAKFRHRLQAKGLQDKGLGTFACPIGHAQINGKLPMEVAVSVAAKVMALYQAQPYSELHQQTETAMHNDATDFSSVHTHSAGVSINAQNKDTKTC